MHGVGGTTHALTVFGCTRFNPEQDPGDEAPIRIGEFGFVLDEDVNLVWRASGMSGA